MTKVLIADDSKPMLMVGKMNLEKIGYTVITANDGKEAVEKAKSEKPDIIFLDAEMPEMDGWEACQALKSDSVTQNIPIMMCTGDDAEEYIQKSKELGASGYLIKPYNI